MATTHYVQFLFKLNLKGQYLAVYIRVICLQAAVLSRWVNRACVVLTVEQLCVNRFLEQQIKGCIVLAFYLVILVKPTPLFFMHTKIECEAHDAFFSRHKKTTWRLHYQSGILGVCFFFFVFFFKNNLMACNETMSVLLSVENFTVCVFFFTFIIS